MGDTFFRVFFISCFVILFIAGAVMFVRMEAQSEDKRQIENYLESRGKAPLPQSWRQKIGNGI